MTGRVRNSYNVMVASLVLLVIGVGLISQAHAKRFTNEYTEFELPPGWDCILEGSEWVCQSENAARKKEAIIILVAKVRGQQDSLEKYLEYLKAPKTYSLPGGKTQVSDAKYTRIQEINNHRWVDALHLASEVPGFYTRYLATVKEDLGVAITFSVSKEHYDSYVGVFDRVVASMRVFRQKQVDLAKYRIKDKSADILDSVVVSDGDDGLSRIRRMAQARKKKAAGGSGDLLFFGLLGLGVIVAIVLIRRKKKGKGQDQ